MALTIGLSSSSSNATSTIPSIVEYINISDGYNLTATSAHNDTDDERNERLAVIEVTILATILVLAIAGNSIVVVALSVKRGKLSRMHLMILHLSLADLSVAFFQVLPQMVWDITFRFQGGAFLCGAIKYLQLVATYASAFVLLSTAVDRYVAICKPFLSQKWTSRHAHLLVLVAWAASLVFSLPQVFIFSLREVEQDSGVYDCWANFDPPWTLQVYIVWNALSIFIAPTYMLALLYGQITYAVWKSSKMAENLAPRYVPKSSGSDAARSNHGHQSMGRAVSRQTRANAWQGHLQRSPATESSPLRDAGCPRPSNSATNADVIRSTYDASCDGRHHNRDARNGGTYFQAMVATKSSRSSSDTDAERSSRCAHEAYHGSNSNLAAGSANNKSTFSASTKPETHRSLTSLSSASGHSINTGGVKQGDTTRSHVTLNHGQHSQGKSPGKRKRGGGSGGTGGKGAGMGISRAKIKTIKLTLTVVICYLVCWTPYYIAQLWAAFDEDMPYDNVFFSLVLLLASVNSCTNPWIYMVFSDTIWKSLRSFLSCSACRKSKGQYSGYSPASACTATSFCETHHVNGVSRL